jgi:hypothetical protein
MLLAWRSVQKDCQRDEEVSTEFLRFVEREKLLDRVMLEDVLNTWILEKKKWKEMSSRLLKKLMLKMKH